MCRNAVIDGEVLSTVSELARAIGRSNVIRDARATHELQDDECLCWVDFDECAKRTNRVLRRDDSGDVYLLACGQDYARKCSICGVLFPVWSVTDHLQAHGGYVESTGPVLIDHNDAR